MITSRSRPRVFILERANHDVTRAARHGDLVHLFEGVQRPSLWQPEISEAIINRLNDFDFNADVDFIAVTGSFMMVAIAMAAIGAQYGEFRALCFDMRTSQYSPIDVGAIPCMSET